ncbi:hypothetical protein KBT16_03200 [Nostoc sp. CCCryo 231-06]|nr:hypothetical protein [Nostoc sp. CCCryo 231-06]
MQEQLNRRTSQLVEKLNSFFEQEQLPLRLSNFGSIFGTASANDNDTEAPSEASLVFDLLYYHLLNQGIMLRGSGGFLSTAHTNEDIERIILAVQDSVTELRIAGFLPRY